jgi:hypothetical protein
MKSIDHLELFRDHMPRGFLREMLVTVYDCYGDAYDHCQSLFEKPEATNIRPLHRRQLIEQSLRKAATGFSGVTATAEKGLVGENGQVGWWYHTLIRCGPIALTQNTVGNLNELARPSIFRQIYAAANPQLLLFSTDESEPSKQSQPLPDGVRLYGMLLHGRSDRAPLPGFAAIRFPNHDYDGYLPGSIDLFREFPDIVAERTRMLPDNIAITGAVEVEEVAEPLPQLRVAPTATDARA